MAVSRCLDDNLATEFVSGALSQAQVGKVESHLASCAECRSLVAALAGGGSDDTDVSTQPTGLGGRATEPAARVGHSLAVGDRVGRYLILGAIGAGGMGVVFSAYDPQLDRKVAIKLLRSGGRIGDAEAKARLRREAQAIAQLSHPNVVGVYDVGTTTAGDLYVAMELVDGDTLSEWMPRWNRSTRDIIDIFVQAGRGLVAAHEVGLLHRDFKPDNVLVGSDGRPRVSDFGLARSLITPEELAGASTPHLPTVTTPLTATGTVLGTPRYMAPEQLTGSTIDARSDQFSFCVALYEALFGYHPVSGETALAMVERGERARPPVDGAKVPKQAVAAIMRGLEREPAKRFPSMSALLAELERPQRNRSRTSVALVAGVAVLAGLGGTMLLANTPGNSDGGRQGPVEEAWQRVRELDQRLGEALQDRQRLREQLAQVIAVRDGLQEDVEKLQVLAVQLEEKDEEIQLLNEEVRELQKKVTAGRPGRRRPSERTDEDLRNAATLIEGDLRGCFSEWRDRNPTGRIRFTVELTITPSGDAEAASTSEVSDSSLPLCVRGAFLRAHYPRGTTQRVAFEVRSAEGTNVNLRVTDARTRVPTDLIELD